MKRWISLFLALCVAGPVLAQDDISMSTGIVGNGRFLGGKTTDGQSTVPMLGIDANSNTLLTSLSGKTVGIGPAKTPNVQVGSSGLNLVGSGQQIGNTTQPPVMTPAVSLTVAAANSLVERVSLMATASPTLAYVVLPAATSNAGKAFGVYNKGASPLLILLNGGVAATDAINASAAATPYSCATTKFCDCRTIGTGTYLCVSQ